VLAPILDSTGILPKNVGKDADVATGGTLWVALWVWSRYRSYPGRSWRRTACTSTWARRR